MGLDKCCCLRAAVILANGSITLKKEKGFSLGRMGISMMVTGRKIKGTEMGFINGLMVISISASGKTTKEVEKVKKIINKNLISLQKFY
jgi:hypothetical protein